LDELGFDESILRITNCVFTERVHSSKDTNNYEQLLEIFLTKPQYKKYRIKYQQIKQLQNL